MGEDRTIVGYVKRLTDSSILKLHEKLNAWTKANQLGVGVPFLELDFNPWKAYRNRE